jgi:hypothetical protein
MKKLEKRTSLPEFQLDDLALEDRRSKILEFDCRRRSLARNRSLDQNVRNTARNLAGYVSDRLYMCEQARRYVGLIRRRDTPLGEPLRKTKLTFSPGAVSHILQRFLAFDGRWAVHSNIRRWRLRISKIKREAVTVNRMLDRLGIEIDPDIRPEACLLEGWTANGTGKTSMSPQATTTFADSSKIDSVPSDDASTPATIPNSAGPDSREESQDRSIENPPQHTNGDVGEDAALIAAEPAGAANKAAQGILGSSGQSHPYLPDVLEEGNPTLVASTGTADRWIRNADCNGDAAAQANHRNSTGSNSDIEGDVHGMDPPNRIKEPFPLNVCVSNNVLMPTINLPPIHIVVENQHVAPPGSDVGSNGNTDHGIEPNAKESGPEWSFELDLENLPDQIEIEGEVYVKGAYGDYYAKCDRASYKQRLCAVLREIYKVPIGVIQKAVGLGSHKSVRDHIDKCKANIDAERSGQNRRKKRAKQGMDGDWPK